MAFTLSDARNTPSRGVKTIRHYPVKASAVIYKGSMVMLEAGEAIAVADGYSNTGYKMAGRAMQTVDNTVDGHYIDVEEGEFRWDNGATLDAADVGKVAYALTDSGVTDDSANHSACGVITEVDDDGVWVLTEIA